jgi:hypothetical protein
MEKYLQLVSLSDIAGIFLIFALLWLVRVLAKKENENIFKAIILLLFFLAVFLYLSQNDSNKLTISDLKNNFFPSKTIKIKYRVERGVVNRNEYIKYVFKKPYPILSVKMDKSGSYFNIVNPESVNKVLRYLDLPEVKKGVPELSSVTGSVYDASQFRWEKYPRGILILEKTLCRSGDSLTMDHCISVITIQLHY